MTLKFFYDNYKLNDIDIALVYVRNNKLYISLDMQIHLDLIANGYRPALDMNANKTFIFNIASKDIIINKPYNIAKYEYNNDILSIEINNTLFIIKDTLVEIE